ncbi:hypothetical protein OGAPHI_006960 [Ogataea philodendri]|uniref:Pre-rRNA-processing protein TSR2 n=1 Tax=Ogataea philodendri TaxID=1378263 RepID=A0A9P8NWJ8_9ASCO|nr:uncharacterized protein OGAPHI_006960 [Ogataea philodendri]KAH3660374.1 hypothetical protein OGAPHI_006960 [Ogataea philodendri]
MDLELEDSGYLCALEGQKTLELADEKKQANFELGVAMLVHGWDILTTAVDNNWGGPESAEKRDWISAIVVDLFKQNKEVDIILIHETLFNAMEDEFDVLVEDHSTVHIASAVVQVYQDCLAGTFDRVQSMYQKYLQKQEYRKTHGVQKVELPSDESGDDDDDEDEDMMDVEHNHDHHDHHHSREPIVDDDGFTVVTKGRR